MKLLIIYEDLIPLLERMHIGVLSTLICSEIKNQFLLKMTTIFDLYTKFYTL